MEWSVKDMKKRLRFLLPVALCFFLVVCAFAYAEATAADQGAQAYPAGNPEDVAAVILHTNDVHVGYEDSIGYDGLALYKKELEELYDHVLLIDAGDAIQGAPIGAISKGAEPIRMMNRLGYDLAVPGNHEFDFGFEALDDRAEELQCGYTCANFCVTGGEPVFKPWRILGAGGLKIGFVGVVAPDTFVKSSIKDILNEAGEPMYDFLADETGERLAAALQKSIDEARENGADYVILVSHLGNNDSITETFRCDAIVGKLSGLDMVIDAHSHEVYNRTVKDRTGKEIPIAQAGKKLNEIGQLVIYKDGRLEESLVEEVPDPKDLDAEKVTRGKKERYVDPEMKAFIDEIVASYADIMERKIGTVSYDMIVREEDGYDISRVEENGLCDFVADAYRAIGGTQVAFLTAGSVRNNLEAGNVTYNSILNMLPYSNDVVTAKVTGQMILDALEFGVSKLPDISAGFPQVSGITFHVNKEIPSSVTADERNQFVSVDGERRVTDVKIGEEPLDPKKEYTLTGTNYVLTGGDGYLMFADAPILTMTMLPDNEVVMKYLEENLNGVIPDTYQEASGRLIWD
jgi:2',3'-cyclic-nucleotide 2'-phosphodiesterase (5'-nucleotidase family)